MPYSPPSALGDWRRYCWGKISIHHGCAAMPLPPPALTGTSPSPWSLGGLLLPPAPQLAGGLLGLLEIFLAGAPEDDAAGHAPDGDGDVQITSNAENIVFHALRRNLGSQ